MGGNRAGATDGPPGCSSGDPSCEPRRSSKSFAIQISSKHVLREADNRGSRFSDGRGVARVGHIARGVSDRRARRLTRRRLNSRHRLFFRDSCIEFFGDHGRRNGIPAPPVARDGLGIASQPRKPAVGYDRLFRGARSATENTAAHPIMHVSRLYMRDIRSALNSPQRAKTSSNSSKKSLRPAG